MRGPALASEPEPPGFLEPPRRENDRRKLLAAVIGSVAVTAVIGWLAFSLGAWGFGYRRFTQHEGRLRRLLVLGARLEQVVQGLNDEGSPLLAAPADAAQLQEVVASRGGAKAAEILEKGRRFDHTRVFLATDMVYFIYFDGEGVMRDFTCVSR